MRNALVTFSLYQPTAFGFVSNAVTASARATRTKYCSTASVNSVRSTLAAFAAERTLSWRATLKSRFVANVWLAAKLNAASTLAKSSRVVGTGFNLTGCFRRFLVSRLHVPSLNTDLTPAGLNTTISLASGDI